MKLKLAENIRNHRREKNLSQEVFAERIGVSFQTVSKWERGECYPDIELLPQIASFFGITIDALMGASSYKEEEDVARIQEELRKYDLMRDEEALIKCAEAGLKTYPNNYLLMAWIVYGSQNINPKRSIALGEYVLANCRNHHILNWTRVELCYAYFKSGDPTKGIEAAKKLPSSKQTRDTILADILEGKEQVKHILQTYVAKCGYDFNSYILKLLQHYKPEEQILLLKKSNDVYDAIYEFEDNVSALKAKAYNYKKIAEIYLNIGLKDEALTYMKEALKCADKHDKIPYGAYPTSILCGCDKYNYKVPQSGVAAHPYQKLKQEMIYILENEPDFVDVIKDFKQ